MTPLARSFQRGQEFSAATAREGSASEEPPGGSNVTHVRPDGVRVASCCGSASAHSVRLRSTCPNRIRRSRHGTRAVDALTRVVGHGGRVDDAGQNPRRLGRRHDRGNRRQRRQGLCQGTRTEKHRRRDCKQGVSHSNLSFLVGRNNHPYSSQKANP